MPDLPDPRICPDCGGAVRVKLEYAEQGYLRLAGLEHGDTTLTPVDEEPCSEWQATFMCVAERKPIVPSTAFPFRVIRDVDGDYLVDDDPTLTRTPITDLLIDQLAEEEGTA